MEGNYTQVGDAGAFGGMIMMLFFFGIYFYFTFAQFKIAQKLNHPKAWHAFVPILNLLQFIQLAGKPMVWFIGLLVPIINIVMLVIMWMEIAKKTGYSSLVGFLTIIPPIGFITIGMMAFGSGSGPRPAASIPPSPQEAPREPQNVG